MKDQLLFVREHQRSQPKIECPPFLIRPHSSVWLIFSPEFWESTETFIPRTGSWKTG